MATVIAIEKLLDAPKYNTHNQNHFCEMIISASLTEQKLHKTTFFEHLEIRKCFDR